MSLYLHPLRVFIFCAFLLTATAALADSAGGLAARRDAAVQVAPAPLKPVPAVTTGPSGAATLHEGSTEANIGQASQLNSGDSRDQMMALQTQLTMLRQQEQVLRTKLAQLRQQQAAADSDDKRRALQTQIDTTEAQLRQVEEKRRQIEAKLQELARQPVNQKEIKGEPHIDTNHHELKFRSTPP